MQEIIRILFLSDIHSIHPKDRVPIDDVKIALQILKFLGQCARYFWFKTRLAEKLKEAWYQVNRTYIQRALSQIAEEGPYDETVLLGDQVHGYQDQGMVTPLTRKAGRRIKKLILKLFGRMIALAGGHETGYILASGAWGKVGISQKSLEAHQTIYGEMHGVKEVAPGLNLIWLSSEPFMVHRQWQHHFQPEQLDWLNQQRQTELDFLQKTLEETRGKFILAVHDSGALLSSDLQEVLKPYQERLLVTLCGHFHARWVANLYYYWHFLNRQFKEVSWQYHVQIVPSVWGIIIATPLGFWHPGAGWAEVLVNLTSHKVSLLIHYFSKRPTKKIDLGSIC
ncbi:MAG: metallophosphoesterase [Patescibacteria group bacterium]|jgi:hypothetical protein